MIFSNFVVTEIYSQVDFLTFDLQILSTGKPRPHPVGRDGEIVSAVFFFVFVFFVVVFLFFFFLLFFYFLVFLFFFLFLFYFLFFYFAFLFFFILFFFSDV